ncbi:helix-turn-helix domain-containing protein [Sneathiella chinensis]|uniref:HTH cro/C1-type domain-containing protein n=1 Tax=Sneathiella chinensis TaxID=349750 RepID=A0ABQ5U590_9PROT|nr:helix-turn-helix domain-containing protein [Sneathiella chinensis]GLQ07294.1 hypothetical protein GCM10007924_25150 [Sneathiella chinensis]
MIDFKTDDPHGRANPVDVHVGQQLRIKRTLLGMTQSELGDAMGLTFQQIQKYEQGSNRIGSSKLYQLSRVLEVPIGYFFEGLSDDPTVASLPSHAQHLQKDPAAKRETLELVRAFSRIEDHQIRDSIVAMVKSVSRSPQKDI